MKIITLALLHFSFITLSQTTKTKNDIKIEEVPHKNIELINSDGTYNSISDEPQMPEESETDNKIYSSQSLDVVPEFPGGKEKLAVFVSKNIQLNKEMEKNKVNGQVIVLFTVEKDGSIKYLKAVRGPGFGSETEALRVLKAMPKWNPGMLNGKIVRSSLTISILIDASKL